MVKNLPAKVEDARDMGLVPGSGRSPGWGQGNPLQYSCLGNPMDRGAWRAAVHGVTQSQTGLKRLSLHTHKNDPQSFLGSLSYWTWTWILVIVRGELVILEYNYSCTGVILEYNYITSYTSYTHGVYRLLYSMWASFEQGRAKDIDVRSNEMNSSWRGKQDKKRTCAWFCF